MKRLVFSLVALPFLSIACSAPPPPPPPPPPKEAPPPPPPPPLAARWTDHESETFVGPEVEGGTLLVIGGKRALVAKDGSVKMETAPSPEPIGEILEVPSKAGGTKLVARTTHGVLRLDDPLGAPVAIARSEHYISRLGSAPGAVAVWTTESELPRFVDLQTGAPVEMKLPALPLRSIAFVDATRGAAVFEAVGVATSNDGGATWQPAIEHAKNDASRLNYVRASRGALVAFVGSGGVEANVDAANNKLGELEQPHPPKDDAALVKWVRRTGRDPLALAASSGVEAPGNAAIVASNGLLARVDLKTGLIAEVVEFANSPWMGPCSSARSGDSAWFGCRLSNELAPDFFDPWGVFKVDLGANTLKFDKPAIVRNGEDELRSSPSGGVAFLNACRQDDDGQACVRQPNGEWKTFHTDVDLQERGGGALADGRLVFVRVGAGPQDDDSNKPDEAQNEGDKGGVARVVALDANGAETTLLKLPVTAEQAESLSPIGAVEEDNDKTIHLVAMIDEDAYVYSGKPGADAEAHKLSGARAIAMHDGRVLAIADGKLQTSIDAGASWTPTTPPKSIADTLGERWYDHSSLSVSDVGARVLDGFRVGWGPDEPETVRPKLAGELMPSAPKPPATPPENILQCKTEGQGQGTPPLIGGVEVRNALATKQAAPKGTKRDTSLYAYGHLGMLDTSAILEEESKDERGAAPTKWTLRWLEGAGVGEKVRQWTGKPPDKAAMGSTLRYAAAQGGRALFLIHSGQRTMLLRVKNGGGIEVVDVPFDMTPQQEGPAFGTEKGEPIAWLHEGMIVAWNAGEAPREIGRVGYHSTRFLGQPSKDGVPVEIAGNEWALARTFPIPPLGKDKTAPPPLVTLEGWSPAPNLRKVVPALEACTAATGKGARYLISRGFVHALVDDNTESGSTGLVDVRVNGSNACVAAESMLLSPSSSVHGSAPNGGDAKQFGMIGILGATDVGDAFGAGGLGLSAMGEPGIANSTIGLGNIGSIGHGAGTGSGIGGGHGKLTGQPGKPAPPPPKKKRDDKAPVSYLRADLLGKHSEGGDRGLPPEGTVRRMTCTLVPKPAK